MRFLGALAALALAGKAAANDSTATVGAGGLTLQKSDSIAMVSEDLFVSVDEVRVAYRFRNLTAVPVTTIVAFPMPPRPLSAELESDVAYPSRFRAWVDGKPVTTRLERKAIVNGKDQSSLLTALGIPLAPAATGEAVRAMDALPAARQAELIRRGLAGEDQWDDDGKGVRTHLVPLWTVADKYWWTQVFAPSRDVRIDHRYVPGAGGSVESPIAFPEFRATPEARAMIADYCIDRAFIAAVDARRAKGASGPRMPQRTIDYVLTTGGNWARPIGDFRLVVDKGRPGNLVSFCGEGVRKISPTRFELRKRNWRPDRDLKILIVEPQG